jgi:hypothetical protein
METEIKWNYGVKNAWIETYTGRQFNVFSPKVSDVNILDIAHALSMCPRFNGHLDRYYSVAEHSWWVSKLCKPEHALAGLLHDASEAYMSDVPRPIKGLFPKIDKVMSGVDNVIFTRYNVKEIPDEIKLLDRQMCLTEGKQGGMHTENWEEGHNRYGVADIRISWWDWKTARTMFLNRFNALTDERYFDECIYTPK